MGTLNVAAPPAAPTPSVRSSRSPSTRGPSAAEDGFATTLHEARTATAEGQDDNAPSIGAGSSDAAEPQAGGQPAGTDAQQQPQTPQAQAPAAQPAEPQTTAAQQVAAAAAQQSQGGPLGQGTALPTTAAALAALLGTGTAATGAPGAAIGTGVGGQGAPNAGAAVTLTATDAQPATPAELAAAAAAKAAAAAAAQATTGTPATDSTTSATTTAVAPQATAAHTGAEAQAGATPAAITAPQPATPAAPTIRVAPTPVPVGRLAQTVERLHDTVAMTSAGGVARAHLQLHPADLGSVDVRLRTTAAGLTATISVSDPSALASVAQAGSDLRHSLEQRGVVVASVDVSLAETGDQAAGNGAAGEERAPGRGSRRAGVAAIDETAADLDPEPLATLAPGALVDVHA